MRLRAESLWYSETILLEIFFLFLSAKFGCWSLSRPKKKKIAIFPNKAGTVAVAGFSRRVALTLGQKVFEPIRALLVAASPLPALLGSLGY